MKKIGFLLVFVLVTGCVSSSPSMEALSPTLKVVQEQAVQSYKRGVYYMAKGRYLLAREQFAEAASLAVTQRLRDDALAGAHKVDLVLKNRRVYYE